jgi:hypothetical protein
MELTIVILLAILLAIKNYFDINAKINDNAEINNYTKTIQYTQYEHKNHIYHMQDNNLFHTPLFYFAYIDRN